MGYEQKLVSEYLGRAIEEFDANHLATQVMRRLAEDFPGYFLSAAMQHLNSRGTSNALRYLTVLVLRQEETLPCLTSPELGPREDAINLFKRFLQIDPSFDVRLARRLPDRRESNYAEALDVVRSTRALDILDETSYGRRLLPVVGHLANHSNPRISAKATLFVGRRMQNPAWTKKQLTQADQRVRANAVEALWGVDSPAAARILEDCVSDPNNRVVGNSLLGLHLLGNSEIQRCVLGISSAGKYQLRSTAAWLLGKMAGREHVDYLTRMVRDEHPQVRSTALRSLLELRRVEANSPAVIAARAAANNSEATAAAVEAAATVLIEENREREIGIRLDGSAFKVR